MLYLEKNCLSYFKRQYADLAEFVAERDKVSFVAWRESSSPYLDRQNSALVNLASRSARQQRSRSICVHPESVGTQGHKRPVSMKERHDGGEQGRVALPTSLGDVTARVKTRLNCEHRLWSAASKNERIVYEVGTESLTETRDICLRT